MDHVGSQTDGNPVCFSSKDAGTGKTCWNSSMSSSIEKAGRFSVCEPPVTSSGWRDCEVQMLRPQHREHEHELDFCNIGYWVVQREREHLYSRDPTVTQLEDE